MYGRVVALGEHVKDKISLACGKCGENQGCVTQVVYGADVDEALGPTLGQGRGLWRGAVKIYSHW